MHFGRREVQSFQRRLLLATQQDFVELRLLFNTSADDTVLHVARGCLLMDVVDAFWLR